MRHNMPTGIYGHRVIEIKICPICNKEFNTFKGIFKQTCSMKCGTKLRVSKVIGTKRKSIRECNVNMKRIIERDKLRKDLESHLIDQLADSYDEGVLC